MQFLQRTLPTLLTLAAVGVVVATFFSDHKADYGRVSLPAGGVVDLPKGVSTLYVEDFDLPVVGNVDQLTGSFAFVVTPVEGGEQPRLTPPGGSDDSLSRSAEGLANRGAIADLEVPRAGAYNVSGTIGNLSDVEFTFGRSSFAAVVAGWKLWGGLLLAAFLIAILPKVRHKPSGEGWQRPDLEPDGPVGDRPSPAAAGGPVPTPAGHPPFEPYKG